MTDRPRPTRPPSPISSSPTPGASRRWTATGASSPTGGSPSPTAWSAPSATARHPAATTVVDATDCLVTPGLVNTHHHLFQNLTRAYPPMTDKPLFGWLQSLYPLWRALDTEAAHLSAWVGLAELALGGCTTSTDHLYLHPHGAGDLLGAEIDAARDLGLRFHPTRGSMSLSQKDGGLPPDDVVADDDDILAASEDAVHRHHDRSHGAMVRIALAPCSPFTRHRGPDGALGRARRAPRRAAAHALRRERRGRRVLAGHVRLPPDRLPRAHRLAQRPGVAGPLRDARRRRGAAARRRCRRRGPLPVEQPHPGLGHRPGRRPAGGRRARRARRRRLVVGRRGVAVAGGPPGDAAGQAARRRRRRHGPDGPWRWPRSGARRASAGRASWGCWRRVPSGTSPCGR